MAKFVLLPWYATVGRGDALADAVAEMAPVVLRYGATRYAVQRSLDDRYKINQLSWFESKVDWYRYWDGPEMIDFRATNMGRYQVPIVYVWHDELTVGGIVPAAEPVTAA
jgi:hypothetical protein